MVISLTEAFGQPTKPRLQAIAAMSNTMCNMGNYLDARALSQEAQQMAESMGDLFEQAQTVGVEARCCLSIGDFKSSARLCSEARELLLGYGMQGTDADLRFQNFEAEIHLLKTEYPEARAIHAQLARNGRPFAILSIGIIDTEMGAESTLVRQNLDAARLQFTTAYGSPQAVLLCDAALTNLQLRDGDTAAARSKFERLFVELRTRDEGATFCLERLADLDHGMYDTSTTLAWAGVYLASALKSKNKLAIMKALRCLGQIAVATGDETTGTSLFQVALRGFIAMEVHSWMADCMVRMADIHIGRGELLQGRELLESARPLFGRCMQNHKVSYVDAKLAALDSVL
jgi:hypothetical protein